MVRTYKVGPSGSFGARYGTVARKRYATVINVLRSAHECPQCRADSVKRLSVGIWLCSHCGFKFAGGAYSPTTKLGEIAERAARAGVASSLLAELRTERQKEEAAKVEIKAKISTRRRRRKTEDAEPNAPKASAVPEDNPA